MPPSSSSTTPTLTSRWTAAIIVQVPELRADVHLRQPDARPGGDLRRVHRSGSPPRSRALKVADGFTDGVQVGPLIDEPALEKVEAHVADALEGGAELVTGGERIEGQFYRPSILTGVAPEMRMSREETFGPVAAIARFETEDEAIAIANATPYGLAAYYMTTDLGAHVAGG